MVTKALQNQGQFLEKFLLCEVEDSMGGWKGCWGAGVAAQWVKPSLGCWHRPAQPWLLISHPAPPLIPWGSPAVDRPGAWASAIPVGDPVGFELLASVTASWGDKQQMEDLLPFLFLSFLPYKSTSKYFFFLSRGY